MLKLIAVCVLSAWTLTGPISAAAQQDANTRMAQRRNADAQLAQAAVRARADPDVAAAFDRLVSYEQLALDDGDASDPFVAAIRGYLASAGESAFLQELGRRAGRARFWPGVLTQDVVRNALGDPGKTVLLNMLIFDRARLVDIDNTTWLKDAVTQRGSWPAASELSARGRANLWQLVWNSRRSAEFQKLALEMMTPLLTAGEVSKSEYAHLFDLVAVLEGRKQRYGTEVDCSGEGGSAAATKGVEAPERVDALRAEMGLTPVSLADYLAQPRFCSAAQSPR